MSYDRTDEETTFTITKVRTPPIVVEGFELVVPDVTLGEVGVVLDARNVVVEVIPLAFSALAGSKVLIQAGGLYMGHSVKETTNGAGAVMDIIDGLDLNGNLLCPLTLVANESTRDWYPLPGVSVQRGITVNVTSGSVSGVVYFGLPCGMAREMERD